MATAQTIIERAMRLIGALDPEETPTATELANGLIALNAMMESWQLDRLMVYASEDVTKALTGGVGSYTIGPTGAIVSSRPIRIESARILAGGVETPLQVIQKDQYDAIPVKTTQSTPDTLYYQPSYPNGTVYLSPIPSGDTLKLSVFTQLQSFALVSTSVSLPPGYERAMHYNLAIEIAPEFQKSVSQEVASNATESKAAIKRANNSLVDLTAQIETSFLSGSSCTDPQSSFMAGL